MISVGNDIVDLNDPDSDIKNIHPRFISRVLNDSELLNIKKNAHKISKVLLWTYWAAKESSYKALKRLFPNINFVYKKFSFQPELKKITYDQYEIYCDIHCDSKKRANYLHAISCISLNSTFSFNSKFVANIKKKIYNKKQISSTQVSSLKKKSDSFLLRTLLIHDISESLGWDEKDIKIKKPEGSVDSQIPYVFLKNKPQDIILSLSHHGDYLSYIYFHSGTSRAAPQMDSYRL